MWKFEREGTNSEQSLRDTDIVSTLALNDLLFATSKAISWNWRLNVFFDRDDSRDIFEPSIADRWNISELYILIDIEWVHVLDVSVEIELKMYWQGV